MLFIESVELFALGTSCGKEQYVRKFRFRIREILEHEWKIMHGIRKSQEERPAEESNIMGKLGFKERKNFEFNLIITYVIRWLRMKLIRAGCAEM